MDNFQLYTPTKIVFGKGEQKNIGELIKPHAKKVLVHYGSDRIKKNGLFDEVTSSLKTAGVEYIELGGVVPNPRLSLVYEGIELCKREGVELILAVGGGSVIDSAKAIAMGVFFDGDVWSIYEERIVPEKVLPIATILTIPAAGSESSPSTVITNEEKQLKWGYTTDKVRPVVSVLNPEFFFTLPKNQIANGVADMMSHIFERYFTQTTHTDITDGLCESVLRTIIKNAPIVVDNPDNYEAWCEIGFAGMVAHNGLLGMGRVEDWACHGMEHELSAIYDIAHGAGLAILTPHWMEYVYTEHVDLFVQFAVNVMGVDANRDCEYVIFEGIRRLSEFFGRLGLPRKLTDVDIDSVNLEKMAKKATSPRVPKGSEAPLGNFKKLNWQDVLEIYKKAL
ncbi:NADH-dependent butanol dehydrogenase A [Clostridia bacterium]|nr:NADH-dependent butanol dehydrogenase A [Clostridia bacterium]